MILKIVIVAVITFVFISAAIFLALRLPQLAIPSNVSENIKLIMLDKWLEQIHKKDKFNGVILLSKKGKVIFSKAYGYDNATKINTLSEHSSFNLASVSKQFTAMGIVLLKEQAKLQYSDNVSDYIHELSYYKDITIQHLLHHISGLPDYMSLAGKYYNNSEIFNTSDMISLYQIHQPNLRFRSGTKFEYSNAGYVLLAEIIERISGNSFQEFMASHIFEPLNMKDTQVFNLLSNKEPSKRVYGFKRRLWLFGGKYEPQDLNFFDGVAGDGGIYSSTHDLNIWHKALRDGDLVSNETYKEAYSPAQLGDGSKTKYGFGWFINADNSVDHAGGWQGFTSYIYRNMENDELIVILDNSSNALRVNSIGFRFNSIGLNLKYFLRTL